MPKTVPIREKMMRHRLHVGRLIEELERHPSMPPKTRAHLIGVARQLQGALYQIEAEPTKELAATTV